MLIFKTIDFVHIGNSVPTQRHQKVRIITRFII